MKKIILSCFLLFAAQFAFAQMITVDKAEQCMQLGRTKDSQTLKNTCRQPIVVIWCHDFDQKGYRMGLCGKGREFFRLNRQFEPGETYENNYSLPPEAGIRFGACLGGYGNYKRLETEGDYLCQVDAKKMEENIATAHAGTREEACKSALEMSDGRIIAGGCVCEERNAAKNGVICRVKSYGLREEKTVQQKAKDMVRDHLQHCDPARDIACPDREKKKLDNGGPGWISVHTTLVFRHECVISSHRRTLHLAQGIPGRER